MNTRLTLAPLLLAALFAGCSSDHAKENHPTSPESQAKADEYLVTSIRDAAINNAIITQHTLYPYHFLSQRAELNDLGKRDLGALAAYFKAHYGEINLRRGNTPDELYQARLAACRQYLAAAGLDTSRLTISDGLPGGSGTSGERVVRILDREASERTPYAQNVSGTIEMPVTSPPNKN